MFQTEKVLFDGRTKFGRYQVVDMVYVGRQARVLFSGQRSAAQAGIPLDGGASMLFDYNQRFLELVYSLLPKSILLIGGGAFTLPIEIIKTIPDSTVDVVEIDPELKEISQKYFNLKEDKRLNIIIGDGRTYLASQRKNYDLILVDAFMENIIPAELATYEFGQLMNKSLRKKSGVCAVNVISAYHGPNNAGLKQQFTTYNAAFKHADIFPADDSLSLWIPQNFLIVSTNKTWRPKYNMRFGSLKPPFIAASDLLHDT
jgi:spermidine synthase